jgi:two-component system, chemotaxis family, protein-glutamate methylesterase/glutaminase
LNATNRPQKLSGVELVAVGASLGGARAIETILGSRPPGCTTPIVVAQHRHRTSGAILAALLQRSTTLTVVEAEDRMPLEREHVYLAPADYHLLVTRGQLHLSVDEPVRYARPSIDVLFESAADAYGEGLTVIVLTGANNDGADGAKAVRRHGGRILVQDPATAEARAMPEAALPSADLVLSLEEIGRTLANGTGGS